MISAGLSKARYEVMRRRNPLRDALVCFPKAGLTIASFASGLAAGVVVEVRQKTIWGLGMIGPSIQTLRDGHSHFVC